MHCHASAALTPKRRAQVLEAVEAGTTVSAACLAFRVSRRFYYRWLPRWQADRHGGLVDASSRPHSSPRRLSLSQETTLVALRRRTGWGADRLAAWLGLPAATCHRVLHRQGLIVRTKDPTPVVRYEHERPGHLLHLDTKRLGRVVGGPGHRATGDRSRRARGVGWEVLHAAVDDASRLVYAEILPDERGETAAALTGRAVAWFAGQGVTVQRILTDNGSPTSAGPSPVPCESSASATPGPGPTARPRTARWNAGSGRSSRSACISRSSRVRMLVGLRSIATSATTTACVLTWALVAGPASATRRRKAPRLTVSPTS